MDQTQTRGAPPRTRRPGEPGIVRSREHYGLWRGVRVTDATLTVGDRTYHITHLRRLRERPGNPRPVRRTVLTVAVAQAAVVTLALVGLVHLNGWTVGTYVIAVTQALVTIGLVGLALVLWPTPTELWALYQGEPTLLYRDADRIEFGKVRRAVERAMLSHRLLKEI